MRHSCEEFAVSPAVLDGARARAAIQSKMITKSNQFPYRVFAFSFAVFYYFLLVVLGFYFRLISRTRPEPFVEELASTYCYVPEMALHKAIELRVFKEYLEVSGKGLDIGSGNGLIGQMIIEQSNLTHLTGLDLNEGNRPHYANRDYVDFVIGDAQSLPFEQHSFDYAISVCVLEHVPSMKKAIGEIMRVLRPRGDLCFSTTAPAFRRKILSHRLWLALGQRDRAEKASAQKDKESFQFHYYSKEEWDQLALESGASSCEVIPFFSSKQLLIYDFLNFQVRFMNLFFADKMQVFFFRNPRIKFFVSKMVAEFVQYFLDRPGDGEATHFLIRMRKRL